MLLFIKQLTDTNGCQDTF